MSIYFCVSSPQMQHATVIRCVEMLFQFSFHQTTQSREQQVVMYHWWLPFILVVCHLTRNNLFLSSLQNTKTKYRETCTKVNTKIAFYILVWLMMWMPCDPVWCVTVLHSWQNLIPCYTLIEISVFATT